MNQKLLPVLFFALFIVEGSVFPWIIPYQADRVMTIVPNPVLVLTILVGVYLHRHKALFLWIRFWFTKRCDLLRPRYWDIYI